LPVVGHTVDFIRDTVGLLFKARRECGDVAKFKLLGKDMILFTGPAAQEAVFRSTDDILSPSAAYKMMVPVFGKGVCYDCEPERMMEQLNMLRPALQIKRMQTYGDIIAKEVEDSIADWGEKGTIDFCRYTQTLTNFTSSHCLLGKEFREELTEEFGAVYYDLERSIVPIGYLNPNLPIPAFRRRNKARARLGEMVAEIVKRRRRTGYRGEDFLQTLMDSSYKDGSKLSDHEITGMLVAAMFAGHHTSSVTTAWTLFELLQRPEFLEEIVGEIDGVYKDGQAVTYNSLRDLQKTEWAVKEALRLHPPLFILLRAAMEDVELAGFQVNKGDWVAVSPMVGHRIEDVFEHCDDYDIHRYEPGRAEDQKAFAYISFGGGRHKCLGNAFALLQIKTIMAILLERYEFELIDEPEADFQGLVIGPKLPCRVKYRRR
jgi:sterol 14-demethylase